MACIEAAHDRLGLDRVAVVPAAQNPRKAAIEGPSPEQRLEMLRIGLAELPYAEVDGRELERGGLSFTVQTIDVYSENVSPENLYLIVGGDQFEEFDRWKDFERILTVANLAVIARPGAEAPFSVDQLPAGLQPLVAAFDRSFIQLTTGRHVEFLRAPVVDVSATDVRKRLRTGRSVDRALTIPVEDYLRSQGLYEPIGPRIGDFEAFTRFCGDALFERKAINVRGFDLRGIEAAAEFTLVASGTSTRHASSLAENVMRSVKEEFNLFPQSAEGVNDGRWVLLDYGSLIVHVFYDFVRQEYRIEDLWKAGRDFRPGRQKSGGGRAAPVKLAFVFVGGDKNEWASLVEREYIEKISRFTRVEVVRVKPSRAARADAARKAADESASALALIRDEDLLVLCDERGDQTNSREFSSRLVKLIERGRPRVVIAVGGAYGWTDAAIARADWRWSFSKLTFPHPLAQAIALEQTYRAFTIWKGLPYHNG